jgi:hypothetical protein
MDKKFQEFFHKILITEGTIPPGQKDEGLFKSLLESANPAPNQIGWLRDEIFKTTKEAISKNVEAQNVLDKANSVSI